MCIGAISSNKHYPSFQGKYISISNSALKLPGARDAFLASKEELKNIAQESGYKIKVGTVREHTGYRKGIRKDEELMLVPNELGFNQPCWVKTEEEIDFPVYEDRLKLSVRFKSLNPFKLFDSNSKSNTVLKKEQIKKENIISAVIEMIKGIKKNQAAIKDLR